MAGKLASNAGKNGATSLTLGTARLYPGFLDARAQSALVDDIRRVAMDTPFFHPETRSGRKLSVRMTSAGSLGWVSDRKGYRYEPRHPSGVDWPPIPEAALSVWRAVSGVARDPDSCLLNYYDADARMGMHRDEDEVSMDWPVVSLSLGDEALFRIGGQARGGKTVSHWLRSGDVVVMAGEARRAYHGIDRVRVGTSSLLPKGGRINLTLRVAGA